MLAVGRAFFVRFELFSLIFSLFRSSFCFGDLIGVSLSLVNALLGHAADDEVDEDAEDESASDFGDGDLTEGKSHTADAGDEDDGYDEEVLVFFEVDFLDHLETGNCDEAVERYADAAHDAGRNGRKQSYERSEEGRNDREASRYQDGDDGSVTAYRDAADGLTVSGIGAAAEEGTCHRADAVTEKGVT